LTTVAARIRDYYREGDDKVIYEKRWADDHLGELVIREQAS